MDLQDKILGAWFGMAVGDALGQSVKGLKPESVRQYFKQVDSFHDVRPYIGKGIRQYRMRGLYGAPTQLALAVCDTVLRKKKPDPAELAHLLLKLGLNGPEGYFGVFRRLEGCTYRAIQSIPDRSDITFSPLRTALGSGLSLAVPLALHQRKKTVTLVKNCLETALVLSTHPWEVVGTALFGCLLARELGRDVLAGNDEIAVADPELIKDAAELCTEIETRFQEQYPDCWALEGKDPHALSRTMRDLATVEKTEGRERIAAWICENASGYLGNTIAHPTQGQTLTLLPWAIIRMVRGGEGFCSVLTETLNQGREADKLGALVGAWAGARFGFGSIPESWKTGLVNAKEIKLRGEALAVRRPGKQSRDLLTMELGLTNKEAEERRRYRPREPKKPVSKATPLEDLWWDEEPRDPIAELREDPRRWRQFERDKARKKRDRRRNRELPG